MTEQPEQPAPPAPPATPVNPATPAAEGAAAPTRPLKSFVIHPAIGAKPGFIWVEAEDNPGKGRVFIIKMKFGKEIERVRMTKQYKKLGAKQVRDDVDPIIGDLLFNEREHGALSEEQAREIIARANMPRRPPPRGPGGPGGGRGGPRGGGGGGGGRGPGGPPRGPGGPGGGGGRGPGGPPRGPRPDGPREQAPPRQGPGPDAGPAPSNG